MFHSTEKKNIFFSKNVVKVDFSQNVWVWKIYFSFHKSKLNVKKDGYQKGSPKKQKFFDRIIQSLGKKSILDFFVKF